jgi:hypothetical protein
MVVPLGDADQPSAAVPDIIVTKHVYGWWIVWVLLISVAIGRVVGLDVLGGVNSGLIAYFIYTMIKDSCKKMTQYCLVLFGFLCLVNALLEGIALGGNLSGRMTQVQTQDKSGGKSPDDAVSYTVTIERHPFFDQSQGWLYILQSTLMIASPVVNFLAFMMCYWSYNAYPTSFFQDGYEEEEPLGGDMYGGGRLSSNYGGPSPYGGAPAQGPAAFQGSGHMLGGGGDGAQRSQGTRLFEGSGQRLGN